MRCTYANAYAAAMRPYRFRHGEPGGENHGMTILKAHESYIEYGICDISPRLCRCTWKATFLQADALLDDRAPFLPAWEESPGNELHIGNGTAYGGAMEPVLTVGMEEVL